MVRHDVHARASLTRTFLCPPTPPSKPRGDVLLRHDVGVNEGAEVDVVLDQGGTDDRDERGGWVIVQHPACREAHNK